MDPASLHHNVHVVGILIIVKVGGRNVIHAMKSRGGRKDVLLDVANVSRILAGGVHVDSLELVVLLLRCVMCV